MDLKSDKQQHIQTELDFSSAIVGEARGKRGEETESLLVAHDTESPAKTNRLMEEVCERENLREALRQVKANKGSAGIDKMTVGQLSDYLKEHWPEIREQLLKRLLKLIRTFLNAGVMENGLAPRTPFRALCGRL
jgi:RNA-directed DNA polymerase